MAKYPRLSKHVREDLEDISGSLNDLIWRAAAFALKHELDTADVRISDYSHYESRDIYFYAEVPETDEEYNARVAELKREAAATKLRKKNEAEKKRLEEFALYEKLRDKFEPK